MRKISLSIQTVDLYLTPKITARQKFRFLTRITPNSVTDGTNINKKWYSKFLSRDRKDGYIYNRRIKKYFFCLTLFIYLIYCMYQKKKNNL